MKKRWFVIFLLVLLIIFAMYKVYFSSRYLFIIEDTSCNCIPNTVYFYSNNTYVTKGINNNIIEKGAYSYDMDLLMDSIVSNSLYDNDTGMNYHIEFFNGDEYFISHENEILNNFLSDLEITWY